MEEPKVDPAGLVRGNPEGGGKQDPATGDAGKGTVKREWIADLPDDLKSAKTLEKFTDQDWKVNLAKSYVELEGRLGKTISIPTEDAPAEEWAKLFAKIGRPEKPEDYELPADTLEKGFEDLLRKKAFAAGATKKQVKEFIEAVVESGRESAKAAEQARAKALADAKAARSEKLKETFGDKLDGKVQAATRAAESLFPEPLRKELEETGFLEHPDFVKALAILGEKMKGTKLVIGSPAAVENTDPYYKSMAKYLPK